MIIGLEVVVAIEQFFRSRKILEVWKRIFVTLIPKRMDAFEPICYKRNNLYATLYKAMAKVMFGRLKPVLP